MTRAITADRLATTAHNGLAATRRHPMLVLPPLVLLVSSAIVLVMLSFAQLTIPVDSQVPNAVPTLPVNDQGTSRGASSTPPKASVHSAQPSHATGHVYASVIRNGRGQAAATTPSPTPDPSSFLTPSPSTSLSPEPSPTVAQSPRVSA